MIKGTLARTEQLYVAVTAELRNFKILLLFHRQVSGQNPLVQPRFIARKFTFSLFLEENICCDIHEKRFGEALLMSTHNTISSRNKKRSSYILGTFVS